MRATDFVVLNDEEEGFAQDLLQSSDTAPHAVEKTHVHLTPGSTFLFQRLCIKAPVPVTPDSVSTAMH